MASQYQIDLLAKIIQNNVMDIEDDDCTKCPEIWQNNKSNTTCGKPHTVKFIYDVITYYMSKPGIGIPHKLGIVMVLTSTINKYIDTSSVPKVFEEYCKLFNLMLVYNAVFKSLKCFEKPDIDNPNSFHMRLDSTFFDILVQNLYQNDIFTLLESYDPHVITKKHMDISKVCNNIGHWINTYITPYFDKNPDTTLGNIILCKDILDGMGTLSPSSDKIQKVLQNHLVFI